MGACYSGNASKSCQTPIDPTTRPFDCHNSAQDLANGFTDNCRQFTRNADNLSFAQHLDTTAMSSSQSTNRPKMAIPSSKLVVPNHRVVPKTSITTSAPTTTLADDYGFNRYKNRRYEASPADKNQVMIFDNSSTTSISSDCSLNLSKSSKSTSSSASNIARRQTSIPRPTSSRTPTPPIPAKYSTGVRKGVQTQQQHKYGDRNAQKTVQNPHKISSAISDRLNGNEVYRSDNKVMKTKSSISNELNNTNNNINNNGVINATAPTYGASIRYTTQVSGLPRPQTAHIVSTSSQSADNHKIKTTNYMDSRLKQYSDSKTSNTRCDPSLRQAKPYFYISTNSATKPYERPNTTALNNSFNYNNRLQYQSQPSNPSKPVFAPNLVNSQNANLKHKSIATNGSLKAKLDFGSNLQPSLRARSSSIEDSPIENQNYVKNNVNPESNQSPLDCYSNDNSFLPKSLQRMRELKPLFARRGDAKASAAKNVANNEELDATETTEHVQRDSLSGSVVNNEVDNRDFLIDDEISDQPELTLSSNIDKKDLMKTLNSELEGLILKQESPSGPSSPSVCSLSRSASSASTVISRSTSFRNRKPRPLSLVEMADGSVGLDSASFRAASQDLIGIKTLLFRLHGLLQNAETLNPFEHNYTQNKFYNQLMISEDESTNDLTKSGDYEELGKENFDLKRQIVLQQQIIEDKDRTIRLLQQQMAKYSNINSAYISQNVSLEKVNASCQTDQCPNASNINPRAVSDGSNAFAVHMYPMCPKIHEGLPHNTGLICGTLGSS